MTSPHLAVAGSVARLDLETVVFDRYHSVRSGIQAMAVEDAWLRGGRRTQEFIQAVYERREAPPSDIEYERMYKATRRAAPRATELLARLRDCGTRVVVIAADPDYACEVLEAIGVVGMVDEISAGVSAPDNSATVCGPGISIGREATVIYDPAAPATSAAPGTPTARDMGEVIRLLGLKPPARALTVVTTPAGRSVVGLGGDLVTVPQHCLHFDASNLEHMADIVGRTAAAAVTGDAISAAHGLLDLIGAIAAGSSLIDEGLVELVRPPLQRSEFRAPITIEHRKHSLRFETECGPVADVTASAMAVLDGLQGAIDLVAVDCPRAACRRVRAALLTLRTADRALSAIDARGEKIDECP